MVFLLRSAGDGGLRETQRCRSVSWRILEYASSNGICSPDSPTFGEDMPACPHTSERDAVRTYRESDDSDVNIVYGIHSTVVVSSCRDPHVAVPLPSQAVR